MNINLLVYESISPSYVFDNAYDGEINGTFTDIDNYCKKIKSSNRFFKKKYNMPSFKRDEDEDTVQNYKSILNKY